MILRTSTHLLKNIGNIFKDRPETVIMNKNIIIGAVLSLELWNELTRDGSIERAIERISDTGKPSTWIPLQTTGNTTESIEKKTDYRWSIILEKDCDMSSKDGSGTPEFIEDTETGDIVLNPEYNSFA